MKATIYDMFDNTPTVYSDSNSKEKSIKRAKSRIAEKRRKERALERVSQYVLKDADSKTLALRPYDVDIESLPATMTTYNVWRRHQTTDTIVCFYVDDRYFINLLTEESAMFELKNARYVVTPDFSQYSNMDKATREHNAKLNKLFAIKMQERGVNINIQCNMVIARQLRYVLQWYSSKLCYCHQ